MNTLIQKTRSQVIAEQIDATQSELLNHIEPDDDEEIGEGTQSPIFKI